MIADLSEPAGLCPFAMIVVSHNLILESSEKIVAVTGVEPARADALTDSQNRPVFHFSARRVFRDIVLEGSGMLRKARREVNE